MKKKDAFYFPHDSNATNDPKIMVMISVWGLEAYGIFWTIIEHLREQPEYRSHIKMLKPLAMRFGSSEEKYKYVIYDFGLFEIENDEFFYSKSLIERMIPLEEKKQQMKNLALKRWNKEENLQGGENNSSGGEEIILQGGENGFNKQENNKLMRTHSTRNAIKEEKIKENNNYKEILRIYNSIIDLFPEHLIPDKKEKINWLDELRMLIEIDKRSPDEIISVIRWARLDEFWKTNFLSIRKLRKKDKNGTKYYIRFLNSVKNGKDSNTQQKQRSIFENKDYPAHWD